jgi:hypothetical protein
MDNRLPYPVQPADRLVSGSPKGDEVIKRAKLFGALIILAAVIGALFLFTGAVAGQNGNSGQVAPPYSPYPSGILPPDLVSEIARVRGEVVTIENEALGQWRALRRRR